MRAQGGGCNGAYTVYFAMNVPESGRPVLICCALPERHYRTVGGYAAQALMPLAFVLDIVTSPIQEFLSFAGAMSGGSFR